MGRKFASLDTTNKLLMLLVLPVFFLVLKELSAIFVPLIIASFFVLLFMPLIRWANRRNVPRWVSIVVIFVIFFIVVRSCVWLLQLTGNEFRTTDPQTWQNILAEFNNFVVHFMQLIGLNEDVFLEYMKTNDITTTIYDNIGKVFVAVQRTASIIFMSAFFIVLLIASSFNAQNLLQVTLFKDKMPSMRTYITIERSISKFILVKFLISLFTGISFSVLCYFFDVKFARFWGMLAFILNFIQMIGSIISTAVMCVFGLTQIATMPMIVLFIVIAILIQIFWGSILEPIFMGRTFSINTVTIIVMLFFWGYVWNIPGMILAVPLTVMVKTILEQFDKTKQVAQLMS